MRRQKTPKTPILPEIIPWLRKSTARQEDTPKKSWAFFDNRYTVTEDGWRLHAVEGDLTEGKRWIQFPDSIGQFYDHSPLTDFVRYMIPRDLSECRIYVHLKEVNRALAQLAVFQPKSIRLSVPPPSGHWKEGQLQVLGAGEVGDVSVYLDGLVDFYGNQTMTVNVSPAYLIDALSGFQSDVSIDFYPDSYLGRIIIRGNSADDRNRLALIMRQQS